MKWLDPSDFDWSTSPPLSSFRAVLICSTLYVASILLCTYSSRYFLPVPKSTTENVKGMTGLQWQPWFRSDLKTAQFLHNINLVGGSATMLIGLIVEVMKRHAREQELSTSSFSWPSFLLCEKPDGIPARGGLYYWTYIYYLSKYYEFLDTFLQLARGKPPPNFFLHVYHHSCVLFMAWAWVETKQSLHFIGLAFNTGVHVVMYTYFLQRTITGKVPRWKSFVTLFQIFQFTFSMAASIVLIYVVYVNGQECAGIPAFFGNVLFNITLLHSFVQVLKKGKRSKNA